MTRLSGKFNGPHTALTKFRNCFEASMTFEEALGCAGLADKEPAVIEVLRFFWDTMGRNFAANCCAEEILRGRCPGCDGHDCDDGCQYPHSASSVESALS